MNVPVAVLAVMESVARSLWVEGEPVNPHAADLIAARSAVADLIDKAENAMYELGSLEEMLERTRGNGLSIGELMECGEAVEYAELREALALVKGGVA